MLTLTLKNGGAEGLQRENQVKTEQKLSGVLVDFCSDSCYNRDVHKTREVK